MQKHAGKVENQGEIIQVILTPITLYVAPIKKKLLLYAVRAVEKGTHANTKTFYGAAAVLSSHDSHDSQGKIQNKTHETFLERKSM